MKTTTHLDVDVIAHQSDDSVSLILELVAPPLPAGAERKAQHVQVVLDRSGSMSGDRIEAAKAGIAALIRRLAPTDSFGLVVFDDQVEVVVPAGPLTNKDAALRATAAVDVRGSTDLCAGYLRGLQETKRVRSACPGGTSVILLSDGQANQGITDPDALATIARTAHGKDGVVTTTVGIGLGYDEVLLSAMARAGLGNDVFALNPDDAAAAVCKEIDGLLAQTAQAVSLRVQMSPLVRGVVVHNDVHAVPLDDGLMLELGSLLADEQRSLVLTFDVPAVAALGLAEIASLELRWVKVPDLIEQSLSIPVTVNVVPGDVAAGRVRDPKVVSEIAYLKAQDEKRKAAEELRRGNVDGASAMYAAAGMALSAAPCLDADSYEEIQSLQEALARGPA